MKPVGTACDGCEYVQKPYACMVEYRSCSDTTGDHPEVCDGADNDCNPATNDEAWFTNSGWAYVKEPLTVIDEVTQNCVPGNPSQEIWTDRTTTVTLLPMNP